MMVEIGRFGTVAMGDHVVDADIMFNGVDPEGRRKIGTKEHSAKVGADSLVGTLARAILLATGRAGDLYVVPILFEKLDDSRAAAEFSTTIESGIHVGKLRGIGSKPAVEPFDRGSFGVETFGVDCATEVISEENVACFAVDAFEGIVAVLVLRFLNHKAEINGKALVSVGGFHACCSRSIRVAELGFQAGRAIDGFIDVMKFWDTFDELVGGGKATKVEVAKPMVPQEGQSIAIERIHEIFTGRWGQVVSYTRVRRRRFRRRLDRWHVGKNWLSDDHWVGIAVVLHNIVIQGNGGCDVVVHCPRSNDGIRRHGVVQDIVILFHHGFDQ